MGNSSFWITVTEFISLPPFLFVLAEILHGWYVIVIILVAAAQMTEHPKLSVTNLNGSIVLPLMISGTTLAFVESIRVLTPFTEWSQKRYGWITGFPVRPLSPPLLFLPRADRWESCSRSLFQLRTDLHSSPRPFKRRQVHGGRQELDSRLRGNDGRGAGMTDGRTRGEVLVSCYTFSETSIGCEHALSLPWTRQK